MLQRFWFDVPLCDESMSMDMTIDISESKLYSASQLQILYLNSPQMNGTNFDSNEIESSWTKMQFFRIENTIFNSDSIDEGIDQDWYAIVASKWTNIKYFYVSYNEKDPQLSQLPSAFCAMSSSLVFWQMENTLFNTTLKCLSEFNQLKYLYFEKGNVSTFGLDILNLPQIRFVSFFNNAINYTSIGRMLDNYFADDETGVYDTIQYSDTLETVYLHQNIFCFQYDRREAGLYYNENLGPLFGFYGCCSNVCKSYPDEVESGCNPREIGNGICDIECYVSGCYYDYGDCNQLCDFDTTSDTYCDVENWSNCRCDQICNKPQCLFDGDDCDTDLLDLNITCNSYNGTSG